MNGVILNPSLYPKSKNSITRSPTSARPSSNPTTDPTTDPTSNPTTDPTFSPTSANPSSSPTSCLAEGDTAFTDGSIFSSTIDAYTYSIGIGRGGVFEQSWDDEAGGPGEAIIGYFKNVTDEVAYFEEGTFCEPINAPRSGILKYEADCDKANSPNLSLLVREPSTCYYEATTFVCPCSAISKSNAPFITSTLKSTSGLNALALEETSTNSIIANDSPKSTAMTLQSKSKVASIDAFWQRLNTRLMDGVSDETDWKRHWSASFITPKENSTITLGNYGDMFEYSVKDNLVECYGSNPAFSSSFDNWAKDLAIKDAGDEDQCRKLRETLGFDKDHPFDVEIADKFHEHMCDPLFTGKSLEEQLLYSFLLY